MPTNPDDRISNQPMAQGRPLPGSTDFEPADSLPSLSRGGDAGGGLSSLAQSAREKQLKSARSTLIAVGVLTILLNLVMLFALKGQLDTEIRKAGLNPANLPMEVQVGIAFAYAITGGFALLGVVFILLGVFVRSHPVPCTVAGLVLFILGWVISIAMNGATAAANPVSIIVKIVIIVALAKAVQAAFAYQRESAEAAEAAVEFE